MLAIHYKRGTFADKWVEYCQVNQIAYRVVNCFDSDIIEQLRGCDGLMWHWPHYDLKAQLFARQLISSLEHVGVPVFPSVATCWHYDDKVGQKYLLEAVHAPLVNSYVFYCKREALEWIKTVEFPIVFKTRSGAGSSNVKLIKNRAMAQRVIHKSFGSGLPNYSKAHYFFDSLWKLRRDKTLYSLGRVCKYALLLFVPTKYQVQYLVEKDYVYFQEFIPGNDSDIRIVVIGARAFALKRFVRGNDFRASGSGVFSYAPSAIPVELVELSFRACQSLKSQSVAFDYIYDFQKDTYKIVEISYAFSHQAYYQCPGYWDEGLNWHEGAFFPEYFMIEDFMSIINEN